MDLVDWSQERYDEIAQELVTLGILTALLVLLIVYEVLRYSDAREHVRHELARQPSSE
jgi:hypothetical protein